MDQADMLTRVIAILRHADAQKRAVTATTLVFSELDLDSLQMLDAVERIKLEFGADLLLPPFAFEDLRTPATIVAALRRPASPPQSAPPAGADLAPG